MSQISAVLSSSQTKANLITLLQDLRNRKLMLERILELQDSALDFAREEVTKCEKFISDTDLLISKIGR